MKQWTKYHLFRKCIRWWKTLFFYLVKTSFFNEFFFFSVITSVEHWQWALLQLYENIVRQLAQLNEYIDLTVFILTKVPWLHSFQTEHLVIFFDAKQSCKICYTKETKDVIFFIFIFTPVSSVPSLCKEKKLFFRMTLSAKPPSVITVALCNTWRTL